MKSPGFDSEAFDSAESFLQSDRRNRTSCLSEGQTETGAV
jgi:hypothetical protein